MISTWYMSKLQIPQNIVVMRGIWFQRENLEKTCDWMRSRLAMPDLPAWDRKFFTKRLEEINNAMERS